MPALSKQIERHFARGAAAEQDPAALGAFLELRNALTRGEVRAAEKKNGKWRVNAWVKKGILLGFRIGELREFESCNSFSFVDKTTFPPRRFTRDQNIRVVPGGSTIREGAFVASSVICMPPMYVNVGAYVDEGTLIDSHALVGSCAQIGKRVHLSASAQIGGVIEPVNAGPVIVEDDVLIGGNCGIYEGTLVSKGAVIGAGTILTRSTPLYDVVRGKIYRASNSEPLIVPRSAVVVPGARAITKGKGVEWLLSLYTPVIVKYRDKKTEGRIELEDLLR